MLVVDARCKLLSLLAPIFQVSLLLQKAPLLIMHPPPTHSTWVSPFPAPFTLQPSSLSLFPLNVNKDVPLTPGQKQAMNHTQTLPEAHASSAMG